jgi:hypothetical protein
MCQVAETVPVTDLDPAGRLRKLSGKQEERIGAGSARRSGASIAPPLPPPADVPGPLVDIPPPHPDAPPAARRRRFANDSWEVPNGYLVWNDASSSLDAHCDDPRHYSASNPCRLNRTCRGRPLGLLIQWLAADVPDQATHKAMVVLKK